MAQVTPPYGTLLYNGLEPSAGDKRSWGVGTSYATVADASFADGKCHNFTVANGVTQLLGALSECDTAGTNYIELAHGDELRFYVEDESTFIASVTTSPDAFWCSTIGLNCNVGLRLTLASGKIHARWFITDADAVTTVTGDYELSASSVTPTYRQIEWTLRRYLDGATTKLELKGYIDGVLKETLTVTPATNTWFRVAYFGPTYLGISDKGGSRNFKHGRMHVSWNNGVINRQDQQFFTTWAPTVIHQYPTSDVTSADEWQTTNGDATDLYKNVDDDPYAVTTDNVATSSTAKKELLLGWANVGSLTGLVVPILNYQDQRSTVGGTSANPKIQAICKNGGGTYKRLTEVTNVTNNHVTTGYYSSNVFHAPPDDPLWNETRVDDNDFGLDKPASGAASIATCSQMWRYVLHSGAAVAFPVPLMEAGVDENVITRLDRPPVEEPDDAIALLFPPAVVATFPDALLIEYGQMEMPGPFRERMAIEEPDDGLSLLFPPPPAAVGDRRRTLGQVI